MRSRWTGKAVDLDNLLLAVERFFAGRNLDRIIEMDRRRRFLLVRVFPRKGEKPKLVSIKISGNPEGFDIDFSVEKGPSFLAKSGFLSTMFGAGFALRGRIDDIVFFERLEEQFWAFIEDAVAEMRK